jgi:hypothetical protein
VLPRLSRRQVLERKLYRELGVERFERYVEEWLDLSPRTARRLVRGARAEHRAPALASAFREGLVARLELEAMLDHATATWPEAGAQFDDYADLHAGRLGIRGRAPDGLVYTLGVGRFGSGDVKLGARASASATRSSSTARPPSQKPGSETSRPMRASSASGVSDPPARSRSR